MKTSDEDDAFFVEGKETLLKHHLSRILIVVVLPLSSTQG